MARTGHILLLDPTGRVMYAAPALAELLGADPVGLRGTPFLDLLDPGCRAAAAAWLEALPAAPDRGSPPSSEGGAELRLHRPGHLPVPALARGRVVRRDDHLVGVRLTLRTGEGFGAVDDAELVRELRSRVEELMRSNRELTDLAMITAHDLRAPLASMTSSAERLVRVLGTDIGEQAQPVIASLFRSAGRMSALIDDVLRMAMAGAEQRFDRVDGDDVLTEVLELLDAELHRCRARVERRPLGTVRAHRPQLVRLLQNLVLNAADHGRGDRPPVITVSAVRAAGATTISVGDDGPGIDASERDGVFSMFRRLRTTTPGTGIGLAACRRIVDAHGGSIWIDRAPGGGTIVSFSLPDSDPQDVADVADGVDHPG